MRGWMCVFGAFAATGPMASISGNSLSASGTMISALFLVLFLIGLLTRVARGRAW